MGPRSGQRGQDDPRARDGAGLAVAASSAPAQPGPDGIDWVTVGAPGNRVYDGPDPFNLVAGRGAVGYEFRIGRTEVTTQQWMEFFNAVSARPDPLPFANLTWFRGGPTFWGAQVDPTYPGPGTRYRLNPAIDNAGMLPVGGVSWRTAAILSNWLHNDRGTSQAAFMNGAYDVTTFAPEFAFPTWTDQQEHHPDARYWVPTLDEWMKAVHYDPAANGGAGRWWQQPNASDIPLTYGPPPAFGGDGTGMANAGFTLPGNAQYRIPLGSYPSVQSPWGLLDAAGATAEWLETIRVVDGEMDRGTDGSFWTTTFTGGDFVYSWGQVRPHDRSTIFGFRLAGAVPCPSVIGLWAVACGVCSRGRRRKHACGFSVA
jgi:formylglycine-generating enzyme required for sulfatase activity